MIFHRKLHWKIRCATRRWHEHWAYAEGYQEAHTPRQRHPGHARPSRSSQKLTPIEKIVLHLNSTLETPIFYMQVYSQKLFTAYPQIPVGITNPSSLSLFVQPERVSLQKSRNRREIFSMTIFCGKTLRKNPSVSKFASNPTTVHID